MTRDDVLKEFYATPSVPGGATDRMADEILRLRKQAETITSMLWEQVPLLNRLEDENVRLLAILAMLRKPDLDVLASAMTAWSRTGDVPAMLHAAIRAAEQGVGA